MSGLCLLAVALVAGPTDAVIESQHIDKGWFDATGAPSGAVTGRTPDPKKTRIEYDAEGNIMTGCVGENQECWGESFEDGYPHEAWQLRLCNPTYDGKTITSCDNNMVGLDFRLVHHNKFCDIGAEYVGRGYNAEQCAQRCYGRFGCKLFSVSCKGDCWISSGVTGEFWPGDKSEWNTRRDQQCEEESVQIQDSSDKKVYELAFYTAAQVGTYCKSTFIHITGVNTTAQCAHACKNNEECRGFVSGAITVDGGCAHGCQISVQNRNCAAGGTCTSDPNSAGQECELYTPQDPEIKDQAGTCIYWRLNSASKKEERQACQARESSCDNAANA